MKEENDVIFEESDEEGIEKSTKETLKKLKEKISNLEKEKQEYLDGWQRSRADYANLQKNSEEDKKRVKSFVVESIVYDLIPVVDSFIMAMGNKESWEKVESSWRSGVEYIYQQLINSLEKHNLKIFGEVGDVFDPSFYEAVSEETTNEKNLDHKVAKVIQKGFRLNENVVRPARVVVYSFKD